MHLPLVASVELHTLTLLLLPFSIARQFSDAHRELAQRTGNTKILPESDTSCWRTLSARLNERSSPEGMKGRVTVASVHIHAGAAEHYALLKGFGARRDEGYGALDIIHQRRNTSCV